MVGVRAPDPLDRVWTSPYTGCRVFAACTWLIGWMLTLVRQRGGGQPATRRVCECINSTDIRAGMLCRRHAGVTWVSTHTFWCYVLWTDCKSAPTGAVSPVAGYVTALVCHTLWAIVVDGLHVMPTASLRVPRMPWAMFPLTHVARWTAEAASRRSVSGGG